MSTLETSHQGETIEPLSRGDALKIDTWPQAIVIAVSIVAGAGLVACLIFAGWSTEAIIGFATLAIGLGVNQAVTTRKASVVEAKTDQQSDTLATIKAQTNGKSDAELQRVAELAAAAVLAQIKGVTP